MYSIWAANNTDNAYTVHQASLFLLLACGITRKKKRKKERKERQKKKSYV